MTQSLTKGLVVCFFVASFWRMVMEDVAYYASNKDIIDELTEEQLRELHEAISEADNNETTDWDDFKKEMNEMEKKIVVSRRFRKNALKATTC